MVNYKSSSDIYVRRMFILQQNITSSEILLVILN
jgi:hypothetical protein